MLNIPSNSDFSIHNLPYGIFSVGRQKPRVGVAIGDQILDLVELAKEGCFDQLDIDNKVFTKPVLNDLIAQGKAKTSALRQTLQAFLSSRRSPLQKGNRYLVPQSAVRMHLPVAIGDYTDFYSSREHATNVGKLFRDPDKALLTNWLHLPVGYHGRASSIVVSDTPVQRPMGQVLPRGAEQPVYQPSGRLDFELEMGFVIGKDSALGQSVSTAEASDYIFGMVLFNDWSARDIQKWEYVPLGPFLGKSFASSMSPWVVPMEALEPFRVSGPKQDPAVLPYLQYEGKQNYNINLTVSILPEGGKEKIVCRSNFRYMYWNMVQQLAHHTVNGCNVRVGDLMASGTISGKKENSYGSLLEMTYGGRKPIALGKGISRRFLADGDTVIMRGHAKKGDLRVGFGEVRGQIKPA
ncbi:MAG: fumarylacetoacetase [Bacteroidota bacterium]